MKGAKKKFGDERFDYIRACKHEIKSQNLSSYNSCPFCKLVQNVTKSFFELEAERQRLNKETSNVNRALMRRNLLCEWSKCQSKLYTEVFPTENVDIFITKSMVKYAYKV